MINRKLLVSLILIVSGTLALFLYDLLPVFSQGDSTPQKYLNITKGIPVLMYHKVSPDSFRNGPGLRVTPYEFERQIKYLKESGYNDISLDELVTHWEKGTSLPNRPVVITFDDGYEDNYIYAFPVLKKYGYTATIFLVYNEVGGYNQWDIKEHNTRPFKLLTWEQIRTMQDYGIYFESHTLNHHHLTSLPAEEAQKEICESKTKLEQALGKPVNYIAYPYGQHNDQICEITQKAGYKAAVTTITGTNQQTTDPYRLKRLRINAFVNFEEFKTILDRANGI